MRLDKQQEQIIAEATLIHSNRGWAVGPRVNDTYQTPDGRLFRMSYYIGELAQCGYVGQISDELPVVPTK